MKKWNSQIMFPTDSCFKNRIIGIKFAPSNSGNPMITLECELVSPTSYELTVESQPTEIDITGIKTKNYFTTKVVAPKDAESEVVAKAASSTIECKKQVKKLLHNLGIEIEEDSSDWDNLFPIIEPLRGKVILTAMTSDIQEKRKTPTSKQIAESRASGKHPEGDIMLHPVTGKKLVDFWPKITEIFGLADGGHANAPY